MSEICDRCPERMAAFKLTKPGKGELYLCRFCANKLFKPLEGNGWTFWALGHAAAPQHEQGKKGKK